MVTAEHNLHRGRLEPPEPCSYHQPNQEEVNQPLASTNYVSYIGSSGTVRAYLLHPLDYVLSVSGI